MKLLPCSACGTAKLAEGPYALPTWPGGASHRYRCVCGKTQSLSRGAWDSLPKLSIPDLERLKLISWEGLGMPPRHQQDLKKHFTLPDIYSMAQDLPDLEELTRR